MLALDLELRVAGRTRVVTIGEAAHLLSTLGSRPATLPERLMVEGCRPPGR